jgi:hypothetical protein
LKLHQRKKLNFFWLISLILLVSCSDSSTITKQGDTFKIKVVPAEVLNLDHKKWYVGKIGRDIVSKGMRVQYRLPQFDQVELKELLKAGYFDSVLLRLKKRTYAESITLDTFYIPFGRRRSDRENDFIISQLRDINLHLTYSASSVDRLARLMCPALKHRFLIDDYGIDSPLVKEANYIISKGSGYTDFMSKIRQFSGGKHKINAGKSMIGTFYLEMAFYDSVKRKRFGNFLPASEVFKVADEERVEIPFCDDPNNANKGTNDNVRSFKFGQ